MLAIQVIQNNLSPFSLLWVKVYVERSPFFLNWYIISEVRLERQFVFFYGFSLFINKRANRCYVLIQDSCFCSITFSEITSFKCVAQPTLELHFKGWSLKSRIEQRGTTKRHVLGFLPCRCVGRDKVDRTQVATCRGWQKNLGNKFYSINWVFQTKLPFR